MKNLSALSVLLFLCLQLVVAQNTKWFVPGAVWKYDFLEVIGPGKELIENVGTDVKNGQTCTKLHVRSYLKHQGVYIPWGNRFEYVFDRNDSVFVFHNNDFRLLYDFTRKAGDTLNIHLTGYFKKAVVDSVGDRTYYDIPVRFQMARFIDPVTGPPDQEQKFYIMERFGAQHFFQFEKSLGTEEIGYSLECYRDDGYPQHDCSFTIVSFKLLDAHPSLQIFPNPASTQITVLSSVTAKLPLEIFNLTGQRVLATEIVGGLAELEIGHFAPGVYLVRVGAAVRKVVVD